MPCRCRTGTCAGCACHKQGVACTAQCGCSSASCTRRAALLDAAADTSLEEEAGPKWFERREPFPPLREGGFTEGSVRCIAVPGEGGVVTWNGAIFPAGAWEHEVKKWQARFPRLEEHHETLAERLKATLEAKEACWGALPREHPCIPTKWSSQFRVDMWGNVVSLAAKNSAITCFDVDHLFPWTRGGRSVMSNFAACHWAANREVKVDALLPTVTPPSMQVGLRPAQLQALLKHAEVLGGESRRDLSAAQECLVHWLTQTPLKGESLGASTANGHSLQGNLLRGSLEGKVLWEALFQQLGGPKQFGPQHTVAEHPHKL